MPRRDVHAFTTRMPKDEFEEVRTRAAELGLSVNELFLRSVRFYLWAGSRSEEIEVEYRWRLRRYETPGRARS